MFKVIFLSRAMNIKIINKNLQEFVQVFPEHLCHGSWKGVGNVLHAKKLNTLIKQIEIGDQCCFLHIFLWHFHLPKAKL